MLRRSLLTTAVFLIAGAAAVPPAEARIDPAAFVNNLGRQLQVVVENPSSEARRVRTA